MRTVKVYDANGNHVDSFKKSMDKKSYDSFNLQIRLLNKNNFYIKGQVTSTGVKIK